MDFIHFFELPFYVAVTFALMVGQTISQYKIIEKVVGGIVDGDLSE